MVGDNGDGGNASSSVAVRPDASPAPAATNALATVPQPPSSDLTTGLDLPGDLGFGGVPELIDRLEALTFTFEALNVGASAHASEAVMDSLARMERRDLQAMSAIETFATALKSVSQHLAHLRHAVNVTTTQTSESLAQLSERMNAVESKAGLTPKGGSAPGELAQLSERLARIESKLDQMGGSAQPDPLALILEKLTSIDAKLNGAAPAAAAQASAPAETERPAALPAPAAAVAPAPQPAPQNAGGQSAGDRVEQMLAQVFKVLGR